MNRPTWVTNDPEAARALAAADKAYRDAKDAARRAPTLAEHVAAIRAADEARRAAYDAALAHGIPLATPHVTPQVAPPVGGEE